MHGLLPQSLLNPLVDWTGEQLLRGALLHFFSFTLVVIRLSGLMITAPGFSSSSVPINIRILLVLVMAFLITPALPWTSQVTFQRLDTNRSGRLEREELSHHWQERLAELHGGTLPAGDITLAPEDFRLVHDFPPSLLDYLWIGIGEFALGLVLGLGAMTILSGLQLAGQLIDQQTGLSLGEVFNPDLDTAGSMTGTTLHMFGVTVFLILGGHLLVVKALVDTFHTLPLGQAFVSVGAIELLSELVHQSLVFALQVSAPLLATMSLVGLAMGFLGHTVPQINVLVVGFPIRVLVGFFVLGLAMTGTGEAIAGTVPAAIEHLGSVLSGIEPSPSEL